MQKTDLLLPNYLFLLGKWYINKRKTEENPIHFQDFLSQLKCKVAILDDVYSKKEGSDIVQNVYQTILNIL